MIKIRQQSPYGSNEWDEITVPGDINQLGRAVSRYLEGVPIERSLWYLNEEQRKFITAGISRNASAYINGEEEQTPIVVEDYDLLELVIADLYGLNPYSKESENE
ncbi:MAG: hypothetical protein VW518_04365 [Burkholderiaceae bacterium]